MARNYVKNSPYRGKSWDGKRWLDPDGTPMDGRSWIRRNGSNLALILVLAAIGFFLLLVVAGFGIISSFPDYR